MINQRPIFDILKADLIKYNNERAKNKKKPKTPTIDLIENEFEKIDNYLITCMNLSDNIDISLKHYEETDIVELYHIYSYKLAANYTE